MEYQIYYAMGAADDHTRWVFGRVKFLTCLVKDQIRRDGLWSDFIQELYLTGYAAFKQQMNMQETPAVLPPGGFMPF